MRVTDKAGWLGAQALEVADPKSGRSAEAPSSLRLLVPIRRTEPLSTRIPGPGAARAKASGLGTAPCTWQGPRGSHLAERLVCSAQQMVAAESVSENVPRAAHGPRSLTACVASRVQKVTDSHWTVRDDGLSHVCADVYLLGGMEATFLACEAFFQVPQGDPYRFHGVSMRPTAHSGIEHLLRPGPPA